MIAGIFEILMLLCFAAAWPFAIYKSYTSRTTKGKSLLFLIVLIVGYLFGITNKFVIGEVNHVLFFYFLDLSLVTVDALLYVRNYRLENSGK